MLHHDIPHEVISRDAAHALGKRHYFTGKPCLRGHTALRYVTTGQCTKCMLERQRQYTAATTKHYVARQQGHFTYPLHPDDHAKVLAYCQALDMSRGLVPHQPGQAVGAKPVEMPAYFAQARQALLGDAVRPDTDDDFPELTP